MRGGVGVGVAPGESLPRSCRPMASVSVGVVSPSWRRRRGVHPSRTLGSSSSGESLRPSQVGRRRRHRCFPLWGVAWKNFGSCLHAPWVGHGGAACSGPRVVCSSSGVSLRLSYVWSLACSMHAHAHALLRRASGSWSRLGSSLLNDDAMTPPRLANRLELPWRSAQSRFVLSFGTRGLWMLLRCAVGFDTHAGAVR